MRIVVTRDGEDAAPRRAASRNGALDEPSAPAGAEVDASGRELRIARAVLRELFGPVQERHFAVRFWNGVEDCPPALGLLPFTLVISSPSALRRMLLPPSELSLAESFVRGDFDVDGDMEGAAALAATVRQRLASVWAVGRVMRHLIALPRGRRGRDAKQRSAPSRRQGRIHTRRRDADAVRSHYDVGNAFYELWLDRRMVYSCAYFETGREDIDTAQEAKLDLLCRKLRLKPGQRLLDIGCGWGGLVVHAAQRYGVHALGVTLSAAQATVANERIFDAGLMGRCGVEVMDYRDLDESHRFDRIVSVGMFEHVGASHLPEYFGKAWRLLEDGGVFVNHGIVAAPLAGGARRRLSDRVWRRGEFIDRYVFPDGELVPVARAVACAEDAGFELRDVENLREHYVLTLRRWVRRLEAVEEDAVRAADRETYRVWRLYLAASAHAFATRQIALAQMVFSKPDAYGRAGLPLTRRDWYPAGVLTAPRIAIS